MQTRRKNRQQSKPVPIGVAIFDTPTVKGEAVFQDKGPYVEIRVFFSALPKGEHGFHIHKAGDLRGEGCQGACAHYHTGPQQDHGPAPSHRHTVRHTGDLGNIHMPSSGAPFKKTYHVRHTSVKDLWGRSLIVHADKDDLGLGTHEDSKTTGHSGARIACAIIGRGTATSCK
jgi:Cu-Zn family superoxide dismutase